MIQITNLLLQAIPCQFTVTIGQYRTSGNTKGKLEGDSGLRASLQTHSVLLASLPASPKSSHLVIEHELLPK